MTLAEYEALLKGTLYPGSDALKRYLEIAAACDALVITLPAVKLSDLPGPFSTDFNG